ncbi:MAG: VCBS repeat-containing protein [Candidatus Hydrogenedentes bacterium]|nr:VCBS repeat-containing protein [Candidatus Hydrogenedentota bacterium]
MPPHPLRYGYVRLVTTCSLSAGLWGILLSALGDSPPVLNLRQIAAILPSDARIATSSIPKSTQAPVTNREKSQSPAVIYADLDRDGQDEIAVAYTREIYTAKEPLPDFRALVEVFKWNGKVYTSQWRSPEFGFNFVGSAGAAIEDYFASSFGVRDMNGDGNLDLFFCRLSFLAEGDRFEAWSWNGKEYQQIVEIPTVVYMKDLNEDGVPELLTEFKSRQEGESRLGYTQVYSLVEGRFVAKGRVPLER